MKVKVIILSFLSLIFNFPIFAQDDDNITRFYKLIESANDKFQLGGNTEAFVILQEAQTLAYGQSEMIIERSLVLDKISVYYSSFNDSQKAIKHSIMAYDVLKEILGEKYELLGSSNSEDWQKSVDYRIRWYKALIEAINILDEKNPNNAKSLNKFGHCYRAIFDYQNAIKYYNKALRIYKKVLGGKHPDYATSLYYIGDCYYHLGNDQKAIEYLIPAQKALNGIDHPLCLKNSQILGTCCFNMLDISTAIKYRRISVEISKKFLGEKHADYAKNLENLGHCYSVNGDYRQAIEYYKKALAIEEELFGEDHPNYTKNLDNLGRCYESNFDYENALKIYNNIYEISKNSLGERHHNSITYLKKLGDCYSHCSEYNKALECYKKILEIRKEELGENNPEYAYELDRIGNFYLHNVGDYQKALEYFNIALNIRAQTIGEKDEAYAHNLRDVGYCYDCMDDLHKALEYYNKALEISRRNGREKSAYFDDIGKCYYKLNDYSKAVEFYNKEIEICDSLGNIDVAYVVALERLGSCYEILCHQLKSLECYKKARDIMNITLAEQDNLGDVANLSNLNTIYFNCHDYPAFCSVNQRYIELVSNNIIRDFSHLTSPQRFSYWDIYSYRMSSGQYYYAYHLREEPTVLKSTFNCAILSKGILLNAETELRDMILGSGDEKMLGLFDRLTLEKRQLAFQLGKPISERTMPTDSLELVCDAIEDQLMFECKAFGDYTKNLAIKWTDVQSKLGKSDIAIEFIEVPISKDTTKYCALVLKKGYDAPHFVELFDLKDFKTLQKSSGPKTIYGNPELYNLVWKPLEEEMSGVENIYFGPSGVLYQTAIEYADNGSGPLSGQKNIYRLSSTRQLATIKEKDAEKTSSIYGGLKYGTPMEALIADSRKYPSRSTENADFFFSTDSLDIRELRAGLGVADLPGTLAEVTDIAGSMDKAHFENTLNTGEVGTEASFKALSGRRRRIIHVATHGFYWTGEEADRVGKFLGRHELMGIVNDNKKIKEDKSLSRSGLLFAGANNALKPGYKKENGVDDGILTAKEIAGMDLRGTDLVVLSACQTGLGEISGEGVFGLQRGFKKAGVNAILMSLWKVDDEATSILMREFYRNYLIRKMTLRQSLCEAQKAVREYECEIEEDLSSGSILIDRLNDNYESDTTTTKNTKVKKFNDPAYWAGFVLLDGLNK